MPFIPTTEFFREPEIYEDVIPSPYTPKPIQLVTDDPLVSVLRDAAPKIMHLIPNEKPFMWWHNFVSLLDDNNAAPEDVLAFLKDNCGDDSDEFLNRINAISPFLDFSVYYPTLIRMEKKEPIPVNDYMNLISWLDRKNREIREHAMIQKRIVEQFDGVYNHTQQIKFMENLIGKEFEEKLRSKDFHADLQYFDTKIVDVIKAGIEENDELDPEIVELLEDGNNLKFLLTKLQTEYNGYPRQSRRQIIRLSKQVDQFKNLRDQLEKRATDWVDASKPDGAVRKMCLFHEATDLEILQQQRLSVDVYCEHCEMVITYMSDNRKNSEALQKDDEKNAQMELAIKTANLYTRKDEELNRRLEEYRNLKLEEVNKAHLERMEKLENELAELEELLEKSAEQ